MSYPPYGGYPPAGGPGYPAQPGQPGGYPQGGGFAGPGYPAPGGQFSMPTPESASSAAYGSAPGGYPPQPGFGAQPPAPGGGYPNVAMPNAPSAAQPTYSQPGFGAPPGPYPSQPGPYPQQPPAPGGYPAQPPAPGGYPAQAPAPGGYPAQPPAPYQPSPAPGGYPTAGPAANQYGAPPGGQYPAPTQPGYGAPPQGQYGAPPGGQQQAYGAPPQGQYGAPSAGPGYGQGAGYSATTAGGGQMQGAVPAAASYKMKEEGTIKPYPRFDPEDDSKKLRSAMKGLGTDEKAIVDILGYRSNGQRQQLLMLYKTAFGRDLINDLKSELSGHFKELIVGLMYRPDEFDAREVRRAMEGAGTNEDSLIEILCTRSNQEIKDLNESYKRLYRGRTVEKDIMSETSGHFRKLLVSMSVGGRLEQQPVDLQKAQADAQRIYQAGERRWGTDENTFNMVLATQSYDQLKAVFDAYSKVSGKDIEHAIKSEMSGDLATGMLTIVKVIRNKHAYFAERLHRSMKGLGTKDLNLIRIVVSRCEKDMKQIKQQFQAHYGQSLEAFVRGDISGDYQRLVLALVGGMP